MSRSSPFVPPAARWASLVALALVISSIVAARWVFAAPRESAPPVDQVTIPDENTPVVDEARVIDPATRAQLINCLHELREKTHAQIKVLTVPSLHGEDIFAFTERHYDLWKLGDKETEKGALVVLAPKEHKVRIHTGRGLEGALPDIWCGTIERQAAGLFFSHGQYAQGLAQIVQAMAGRVADDEGVKLTGLSNQPLQLGGNPSDQGTMVFFVVFFIMVIALIVIAQMQRRQQGRWGQHASGWGQNNFPYIPGGFGGMGGGYGGWSSGGGGSGGWSSGGSDFGGGGSSAGGGADASW